MFCWLPAAADFFLAVERCHFVPVGIYMFKVNSRNSTARCEIYSNLTTNTSELRQCSNRWLYRSSHRRSSVKKVALKNFANFTGNQLCWILFLIKLFEIFTSTYLEEYLRTTASDLNFFYPLLPAWNDKMQILPTEQKLCSKSTKRYQVSYYQLCEFEILFSQRSLWNYNCDRGSQTPVTFLYNWFAELVPSCGVFWVFLFFN